MNLNISVIIPVYNASEFLRKAVESALQFEEVQEILLIEDGSTDESLALSLQLAEKCIKVHLFQHSDRGNHGAAATRNLGIEKTTQEFTAFLDADDYYLPNRFDAEKELFENEEIEGVFGAIGVEFLSESGKREFQEKFKNTELTTVKKACEGKQVFRALIGLDSSIGTFFHLNGLTIRTNSILKNNLRLSNNLRVHQDSDFIIKLAFCCFLKSGNISSAIAIRGVHDNNRITKITNYSEKYKERQFLLWKSIYDWSLAQKLQSDESKHLLLIKTAYELSQLKGVAKIYKFMSVAFRFPDLLKTRYRFIYLNY